MQTMPISKTDARNMRVKLISKTDAKSRREKYARKHKSKLQLVTNLQKLLKETP
jgi:hypothetical protein